MCDIYYFNIILFVLLPSFFFCFLLLYGFRIVLKWILLLIKAQIEFHFQNIRFVFVFYCFDSKEQKNNQRPKYYVQIFFLKFLYQIKIYYSKKKETILLYIFVCSDFKYCTLTLPYIHIYTIYIVCVFLFSFFDKFSILFLFRCFVSFFLSTRLRFF